MRFRAIDIFYSSVLKKINANALKSNGVTFIKLIQE